MARSNRDDLLVRQDKLAWPSVFRQARFIPALEYLQALCLRTLLMRETAEKRRQVDVYVAPSFGENLDLINLTGHPAAFVSNGFDEKGNPTNIAFIGRLFGEAELLWAAKIHHKNQEGPPGRALLNVRIYIMP